MLAGRGGNFLNGSPSAAWWRCCVRPADQLPVGIDPEVLLAVLRRLAWESAAILRAYARGEQPPSATRPCSRSMTIPKGPVSAADLAVNDHLLTGLGKAFPIAPWTLLSEETASQWARRPADRCRVALDPRSSRWATKDFLQGTGEYAVHLALIHQQRPVLGVVLLSRA